MPTTRMIPSVSRRTFLAGSGLALAAASTSSFALAAPSALTSLLSERPRRRNLLLIPLRGGNDGIGTVIPHGDPSYNRVLRPTLFIERHDALDLNGFASLHPALAPLLELYSGGQLLLAHRVGYPRASRSHMVARRVWSCGNPADLACREPWIDRFERIGGESIARTPISDEGGRPWDPIDARTGRHLFPERDAADPRGEWGPGARRFFGSLKSCVKGFINSNGPCMGIATLDGFDLHRDQGAARGRHAELLSQLAFGIRSVHRTLSGQALFEDKPAHWTASAWDETVVVAFSEFGRASAENRFGGTDHGTAGVAICAGGRVRGGVVNADRNSWQSGALVGENGLYLPQIMDFRSLFWELLRGHMGAPEWAAEIVFPGLSAAQPNLVRLVSA